VSAPALRRVVRRETHSSRTAAAVVAVVVFVLLLGYVAAELVAGLAGQPALLVPPAAAWEWLVALPTARPTWLVVAGGAIVALAGLALVWLGVAPGRLSRQTMDGGSRVVVVDNGVIASSLAQHLSEQTATARERITVGVGHRAVDITVRPVAGARVDVEELRRLAQAELDAYRLRRGLRTRVRVSRRENGGTHT
jgi:hypothetical protein